MKKRMITLISVLALAFAFAGCSESGSFTKVGAGSSGADGTDGTDGTVVEKPVTVDDSVEGYVNGLGISAKLGTPPTRP